MDKELKFEGDQDEVDKEYWILVFDEISNMLDRQNTTIKDNQRHLIKYVKFHMLFIGFTTSLSAFALNDSFNIDPIVIALTCLPSVVGIFYTLHGHYSMGKYSIGLDLISYKMIDEDHDMTGEKFKTLCESYNSSIDDNRERLDAHEKYRRRSLFLLSCGFGFLMGLIISI